MTSEGECRLILFDVDGTLIQSGGAGHRSLERAFLALFGVVGGMEDVSPQGRTDVSIVREMFQRRLARGPTVEELDAFFRLYLEVLEEEVPRSPGYRVMPGVVPLLERLSGRPDVILGLGTGNIERGARLKLARADLNRFFSFGGFGDEGVDRPEIIRRGIRRGWALLDGAPRRARPYVVGDTGRDVGAGRAAGAVTVGVATGAESAEELARSRPDHLLADLADWESFSRAIGL
ncbi:MAG: HAD family hydrolase [Nitrospinota bacterium]